MFDQRQRARAAGDCCAQKRVGLKKGATTCRQAEWFGPGVHVAWAWCSKDCMGKGQVHS